MSISYTELPSTRRREVGEARDEYVMMCRAMSLVYFSGIGFIALWAALLGEIDVYAYATGVVCLMGGFLGLLLVRYHLPKRAFIGALVMGVVIQTVLVIHYQQITAGFFLLLPAMYCAIFFWNDRPVAIGGTIFFTIAFICTPLIVGGEDVIARIVTTTPIFLGLVLTTGYLGHESAQMDRNRGRFESTISSLLVALQERDGYTADHSEETVDLALAVGDHLRIEDEQRTVLADVALLHDIGKIGIPNEILNKREGLEDHEWEFMKRHPEIGERIVSPVPGFGAVAKAIRHEHERWDGAGYPDGLVGDEIPLPSRIVLVCDAFHAMITDRPYRKSIGMNEARNEMIRHAGTQFDPDVVEALLTIIDEQGVPESVGKASWNGTTNAAEAAA
ncbi:MAG: HD-GYP domain-containing protein [Thermoleophilaceae bacterium]|nr:HD-GYP domain-containing protein [Thermoleophilaceae bacterium]